MQAPVVVRVLPAQTAILLYLSYGTSTAGISDDAG